MSAMKASLSISFSFLDLIVRLDITLVGIVISLGTTSCMVLAYAEYRMGPATDPCGTEKSRAL